MDISKLKFNDSGLIPAIAQDVATGAVLMLAWMSKESIQKTEETGWATYFSRSRQSLWRKGESSGHTQRVREMFSDCDGDTLLLMVEQTGPACHTGAPTCFQESVYTDDEERTMAVGSGVLQEVMNVILDRREHPKEGSYTNYLFDKGVDKICKKVGEESAECIIAAKNSSKDELRYEAADLLYHLMVLMANQGLTLAEVYAELNKRR